jgi:N-acetylmuramoyl-L-alanine amidase
MLNIQKKLIGKNFESGNFNKKYIVIHETDNTREGAGADAHYRNCNNNDTGASVHFFVDDKNIIQVMELKDKAWHVGVKYGTPKIKDATNSNTIGIEMCVNPDSDYNTTWYNTVDLVRHLMKVTGIPAENVITHHDACVKWCPRITLNNGWWTNFKEYINNPLKSTPTGGIGSNQSAISNNKSYGVVTADVLNVRAGRGTKYEVWDKLYHGKVVELGELKSGWYLIYYNDGKASGYVSSEHINKI